MLQQANLLFSIHHLTTDTMKLSEYLHEGRSPVLPSPSVESSLAIARIFGGFPRSFFEKYHEHLPKTEPVDQYELRADLYELYHYLNHTILFGVCSIFVLVKVEPDLYEEFLCRKCFAQDGCAPQRLPLN